jgi:hypothetical protein
MKAKVCPWKRKLEESGKMKMGQGRPFKVPAAQTTEGSEISNTAGGVALIVLKSRITGSAPIPPSRDSMPIMPGRYPPKASQQSEVIFEHNTMEVVSQTQTKLTVKTDDLVVLEPAASSIHVRHGPPPAATEQEPISDPYNLDHYLLTSAEGFSPFEQNLGEAPFHDLHGENIWASLAYVEDGGVHPGKVRRY